MPYSQESDSKKKTKKTKASKAELSQAQWWRYKEYGVDPHEILDGLFKQIEDDQSDRYTAYKEYERLFGATVRGGVDDSLSVVASDDLQQNELQNTIETLWAQVFKNKVVPAVSVSEADYEEWERAKAYSRWVEGAFDEARVHQEHIPQAGAFSLVHGTGLIRVGWEECDKDTAKVTCWAVNPRYFFVDRMEAKHGKPRSIFFKDHLDRFKLINDYCCGEPDADYYGTAEERKLGLEKARSNDDKDLGYTSISQCDMVTVKEAFHLPSGPHADDGLHVIWVRGCTLMCRKFTWDRFPLAVMRFGVRMEGYYGESAVRRLAPTQKNLDKLNLKIDEGQDIMGVPRIVAKNNCGLKVQHVDDIPGGIIMTNNPQTDIKDWNAQCVSPELYESRDMAGHKMRALLGVSDFEAQQQIPQGMRDVSGAFLERWVDQGQARHAMFHSEYENAVVDIADLFMLQANECKEMGYDVVVRGPDENHNKTSIDNLSFKEVCIDRKKLKLKVQPMSQLPQTFAGKVEAIEKMRNNAKLPLNDKTAMRMLEIPDVHTAADELVSDEEIIRKNINYMVKQGKYINPLPFDNFDLIIQLTTRFINTYRVRNDADYHVVGLLAQYIDEAIILQKGQMAQDPNAPPAMPMSTMGAVAGLPPGPVGSMPPPMPGGPQGAPMGLPGPAMGPPMGGPPLPPGPPAPAGMPPMPV